MADEPLAVGSAHENIFVTERNYLLGVHNSWEKPLIENKHSRDTKFLPYFSLPLPAISHAPGDEHGAPN